MRKRELVVAIKAAAKVARETDFFLIGSQVVHAFALRVPTEVLLSQECDLYPVNRPEAAHLLSTELGRGSRFAQTNGFYVDVVTPELATLPEGWNSRLKVLHLGKVRVHCLDINDLIASKLVAARLKDLEFVEALLRFRLTNPKSARAAIRKLALERDVDLASSKLDAVLNEIEPQRQTRTRRQK